MCFGTVTLTASHIARILALPHLSDAARQALSGLDSPPAALLVEYFPNPEFLAMAKIDASLADQAMKSLRDIHASYILHGNINWRNVFVVPRKHPPIPREPFDDLEEELRRLQALEAAYYNRTRLVWVGFARSTPFSQGTITRRDFLVELHRSWDYFYRHLVGTVEPDSSLSHQLDLQLPAKRIQYEPAFEQ